jgi:pyruvate kinase
MTKIVGTLGPKSRSVDTISACLKAGMSGNHTHTVSLSQLRLGPLLLVQLTPSFFFPFMLYNRGACSVARFDFSWGDAAYHQETLENLKLAIKATKKLCAVSHSLDCSILIP